MTYITQPGTIPHRVIKHLKSLAPGTELSSVEISDKLGLQNKGMTANLATALRHGALKSRRLDGIKFTLWSLGDGSALAPVGDRDADDAEPLNPTPPAPPGLVPNSIFALGRFIKPEPELAKSASADAGMRIALWSDGTLEIHRSGGRPVVFEADETAQLVHYLDRIAQVPS